MDAPTNAPRGYGCLIALGLMIGPVVGWFFGQVALGMAFGLVVGVVVALWATLADRS